MTLADSIEQFLANLERIQGTLVELFADKRRLLVSADNRQLQLLAERESAAARGLQAVVSERNRLLLEARRAGWPAVRTLGELLAQLGAAAQADWSDRLRRAEETAAHLRRESWVHWIISHRCYNHYTELLDLIAQGGTASPTYSRQANRAVSGGVVLDATA